MNVPKDPQMLLSFVNTKLRDDFKSLDLFCDNYDKDKTEIIEILSKIDYSYDEKNNKFI